MSFFLMALILKFRIKGLSGNLLNQRGMTKSFLLIGIKNQLENSKLIIFRVLLF